MIQEFIKTLFLIFIAEVGDKTQILLITCAARFSVVQVLIGIVIGVFLNHGLAILIGIYISNIIATDFLEIVASIVFIIFGILSFIDDEKEKSNRHYFKCGPILTVAGTFFLGELGDKTQLTAMTIAMESEYPLCVLMGSVLGMVIVGLLGIIIGNALTKSVSSYIIKIISGLAFIAFGTAKIFTKTNIFVFNPINQGIYILLILFISLYFIRKLVMNR
jgi:putative Ca2+/H+ antiporter (TMEM165/GDT1 family)